MRKNIIDKCKREENLTKEKKKEIKLEEFKNFLNLITKDGRNSSSSNNKN